MALGLGNLKKLCHNYRFWTRTWYYKKIGKTGYSVPNLIILELANRFTPFLNFRCRVVLLYCGSWRLGLVWKEVWCDTKGWAASSSCQSPVRFRFSIFVSCPYLTQPRHRSWPTQIILIDPSPLSRKIAVSWNAHSWEWTIGTSWLSSSLVD